MGIFRGSSWAHSQGTCRVRALGSKPRFWSTAKELQGTILYQYHGTTVTAVVVRYGTIRCTNSIYRYGTDMIRYMYRTVGLHGIEVSFGSGQTPRACEVRSKNWLLVGVRLGVICPPQKTASRKTSIRAGRLQKTTDFRSFWGWWTLLTAVIACNHSSPPIGTHSQRGSGDKKSE